MVFTTHIYRIITKRKTFYRKENGILFINSDYQLVLLTFLTINFYSFAKHTFNRIGGRLRAINFHNFYDGEHPVRISVGGVCVRYGMALLVFR